MISKDDLERKTSKRKSLDERSVRSKLKCFDFDEYVRDIEINGDKY